MAPRLDDSSKRAGDHIEKLPRLPKHAKIQKRALLYPQISSPHAGTSKAKVVYVSSKTPFVSALKRVRQLLHQIDKRKLQSELSKQSKNRSKSSLAHTAATERHEREGEPVIITATGKAIDKALSLALFFQNQNNTSVKITTTSADAIDDVVPREEYSSRAIDDGEGSDADGGGATLGPLPSTAAATSKVATTNLDSHEEAPFFPESRIRHTSVIQVSVSTERAINSQYRKR